ncbi:ABC transporter ATP-binding protein [Afifella sp. IM 167]|uniref:ABC transporter ATP-binding protein n=1 Tax=Afifella sp. IM 167 TaxID=2033586 RepID=UPI001CC9672C|nr:ABC transporter ATP-binding protein [Afifella sp. IM 167]MBZ8131845.1 polyamine ABC transporter ATP-binding protein [Afifella sp. IM 167]
MRGGSIRLEGIRKDYGNTTAVSDVTLDIPSGQFVSLLGPSGSGKTTTLMMIAGFVPVTKGAILIDEANVSGLPPQRRNLGVVFQNYALFPHLSVAENIAFPLRVRKHSAAEIDERVKWALDMVRLSGLEKRLPGALSGGQQQRVALARAIVYHPPVVLMDEPLGALDKNLRYQMQVEIKEIQQRLGMTVVYVTHDQEEAMNMSDVIVIMNHGRIEQLGEPRRVYEEPSSIFTGNFLGEANLIRGKPVEGEGVMSTADGRRLSAARTFSDATLSEAAGHFVRPEKISLSRQGAGGEESGTNALHGSVSRVSFLGNVIRYGIDIGEDTLLTADCHNGTQEDVFSEGDAVVATWRSADSLMFRHV